MPLNAAEWIQLRERQHAEGIVTTGELCTAFLQIAGEFNAAEVFAAMDKEFLVDLLAMCRDVPAEDDFCIFHRSPTDSRMHYEGLRRLHSFAEKNHMWVIKAQPVTPADASRRH
jgi:muconolactone delta-isomerase